jgi:plastocyanin
LIPKIVTMAALSAAALALMTTSSKAAPVGHLTAIVGPGFNISMNKKRVPAGRYTITVNDRSNVHNFHLKGPGLNKATSVSAVKTYSWTVTLKKGTYTFVCDPHDTIMVGTLKVT